MNIDICGYIVYVDEEDVDLIKSRKWCVVKNESTTSNIYFHSYRSFVNGKTIRDRLHRLIMGCSYGDGNIVDHINGNTLDCRKSNLRVCNHANNMHNAKIRKDNKTGYKGVSYNKRFNKYCAFISVKSKTVYLGSYDTPEMASEAYEKKASMLRGDYHRITSNNKNGEPECQNQGE